MSTQQSTVTTVYKVTGMSCGHCETAIRGEVGQIADVTDIDVSSSTGKLVVTTGSDTPADDAAVLAAVEEAGYDAQRA